MQLNLGSINGNSRVSLAFNPSTNIPYVACSSFDGSNSGLTSLKIKKLDGTSWSQIGENLSSPPRRKCSS